MIKVVETERIPIKLWLDDIEDGALAQATNLAKLPFAFKHIAIMPDSHQGYGMPIGGVLATDNVIVPNAVGVDIGCGMVAVKTGLKEMTRGVILKAHKILMLHQKLYPDQKGYLRHIQVWIGGREGLSWPLIPDVMNQWILNVNDLLRNGKNEDEGFLARVIREQHVKFENIHPFVDGNGRIGRMLMNWTRIQVGLPLEVIEEAKRQEYYKWFKTTP